MRLGQVVLTEGNRNNWGSKLIEWATDSWATHSFIVTGEDQLVESVIPRVRTSSLSKRMRKLYDEDRAYAILDLQVMEENHRKRVAKKALSYVGRFYDWPQAVAYGVTGDFWNDGPLRLVCSRLITAAYFSIGVNLFTERVLDVQYPENYKRLGSLRSGYIIPPDLLRCSLTIESFVPSSRVHSPRELL